MLNVGGWSTIINITKLVLVLARQSYYRNNESSGGKYYVQKIIHYNSITALKGRAMLRRMCILIASLMLTTTAWAQNIITVDNNVPSGAMYLDLQQAIDAANNGDIIYVSGSETRYGDITIDTRLTLIGTGHKRNPGIQIPLVSRIASVSFSEGFGLTSDSSKIIGFQIDFSLQSSSLKIFSWAASMYSMYLAV